MLGGCLGGFWTAWSRRGADAWVVEALREGYRIPFLSVPSLSPCPAHFESQDVRSEKGQALRDEIRKLLESGAVERVSSAELGFFQPRLCGPKVLRRLASNNGPTGVEQEDRENEVSYGDRPISPLINSEERLDGFHRPQGCLSSNTNASREQKIPPVYRRRGGVPVSNTLLRLMHSPSGVYKGDGSNCKDPSQQRDSPIKIFRRLVDPSNVGGSLHESEGYSNGFMQGIRHNRECGEVLSDTSTSDDILRHGHQLWDFEGFSDNHKTGKSPDISRRISVLKETARCLLADAARAPLLDDTSHSRGETEDEVSSVDLTRTVVLQGCKVYDKLGGGVPSGSALVARARETVSGLPATKTTPRRGFLVRCVGRGLGSPSLNPHRELLCIRPLEPGGEEHVHQQEGNQSSEDRTLQVPGANPEQSRRSIFRQHHVSGISEEPGWHKVQNPQPGSTGDHEMGGGDRGRIASTVSQRLQERRGGFIVEARSGPGSRVDPLPGHSRSTNPQMADNNRSVCDVLELQAPGVLCALPGSNECRGRCSSPTMGQLAGICVPPLSIGQGGTQQSEAVEGLATDSSSPLLAPKGMVPRPSGVADGSTGPVTRQTRSTQTTPLPQVSPEPPRALPSCVETVQRFARQEGFSKGVAKQIALARRPSTNVIYQQKWSTYRSWCKEVGVSVSRPTIPKIANFLLYLRKRRRLSVSAVKGYRSVLAYVFRSRLSGISSSPVLRDLVRSFSVGDRRGMVSPPSWDLNKVLKGLMGPPFEPLQEASLRNLTKKALFLLSLASVRRIGEIQAISSRVAKRSIHLSLSYLPEFVAKTENEANPIPRSFLIKSLSDYAAGLEEGALLCPVRTLEYYLERTRNIQSRPKNFFVSPRKPQRPISKNAISFFLRETIAEASALVEAGGRWPRAHSIRGVGSSLSFWRNWSMSKVLEAATWKSNTVFTSFYLKDVEYVFDDCRSLGPFVSAGQIVNRVEG